MDRLGVYVPLPEWNANRPFGFGWGFRRYTRPMRPRTLILAISVMLALAAGLLIVGVHGGGRGPVADRAAPNAANHRPAPSRPDIDLPPELAEALVPMQDVLPMHKAVRAASRRFDGRVLDIALIAPRASDAAPLVYHIRMLTSQRNVLDIRMDALTGRFIEVRGADLGTARRQFRKTRTEND